MQSTSLTFTPSGYVVEFPDIVREWAGSFASGMMDQSELEHLAATLAAYPWDDESVLVEIGAFRGDTTVFMSKVLGLMDTSAPILSIDPFELLEDPRHGTLSFYLRNIQLERVGHRCFPLVALSQEAAAVVPDNIGVLVVDGAHDYASVSKDLELYAPKIASGGLMFIDDYAPAYPDVMRAVDEYFVSGHPFTILHQSYFVIAQRQQGHHA